MKTIKTTVLFVCWILASCTNTDSELVETSLRKRVLETGKQKETFQSYSPSDQTDIWLDKFNQLGKITNLPPKVKQAILAIKRELEKVGYKELYKTEEFVSNTLLLEEMVPRNDLIAMFSSLEDYYYSGHFNHPYPEVEIFRTQDDTAAKAACDCRWTCASSTNTSCQSTQFGCGFMWLQSCNKKA